MDYQKNHKKWPKFRTVYRVTPCLNLWQRLKSITDE